MAVNRFRQVLPQLDPTLYISRDTDFLPDLSGLSQVIGEMDEELDASSNLPLPNYLKQSESDREVYQKYRNTVEGLRQSSLEAFKSDDIVGGRRKLKELENFLRKSKQPDGDFVGLEGRLKEYQSRDQELRKTYLDPKSNSYNPRLYDFYRSRLDNNLSTFRDQYGQIGTINTPSQSKFFSESDLNDYYNDFLDNIEADQIVKGKYARDLKGVSFKQLLERGETKFIDYSKVAQVLARATTPEIREHFQTIGQAYSLPGDQGQFLSEDQQGFNEGTLLGNYLDALTRSKVFQEDKDKSQVITDDAGLAKYKSLLRRQEADYEFNLGSEHLRTQVFTKGTGMKDIGSLNYNKAGLFEANTEIAQFGQLGPGSGLLNPSALNKDGKKIGNFSDYITSDKAKQEYPALVDLHEKFGNTLKYQNMSDKEQFNFLKNKYKEKQDALSATDAPYELYGPKKQDLRSKQLLGNSRRKGTAAVGNIRNKTIIVHTQGKEPEAMTFNNFLTDYLDVKPEDFVLNSNIHGAISPTNPMVASGEVVSFTNPKSGEGVTFIASDISVEDARIKSSDFELAAPLHNGTMDESQFVNTRIPELDQAYGPIKSVAEDIYESDVLFTRLESTSDPVEEENLNKRINELRKDPSKDRFIERQISIYDQAGRNLTEEENLTLDKIIKLKEGRLRTLRNE